MSRLSLVCVLVLLSGCAMKSAPREPTAAPRSDPAAYAAPGYPGPYAAPAAPPGGRASGEAPSSLTQAPTATVAPPATSAAPVYGGVGDSATPTDLPSALARLDAEARALGATLTSCPTACRSLGSMERAVHVVCELTRDGDHARCDEARKKLRDARERVRNGCGVCEGGPRTDAGAPDP